MIHRRATSHSIWIFLSLHTAFLCCESLPLRWATETSFFLLNTTEGTGVCPAVKTRARMLTSHIKYLGLIPTSRFQLTANVTTERKQFGPWYPRGKTGLSSWAGKTWLREAIADIWEMNKWVGFPSLSPSLSSSPSPFPYLSFFFLPPSVL